MNEEKKKIPNFCLSNVSFFMGCYDFPSKLNSSIILIKDFHVKFIHAKILNFEVLFCGVICVKISKDIAKIFKCPSKLYVNFFSKYIFEMQISNKHSYGAVKIITNFLK